MPAVPERRCNALASRQHGVLSRAQAARSGMSDHSIAAMVRTGRWTRVHPGVYRPRAVPTGWRSDLMAAVLWGGPSAIVSHRAAGRLYELAGLDDAPVEITVACGHALRGVIVHRAREDAAPRVRRRDGFPVTTVERTLLDIAAVLPAARVGVALDDALRRRLTALRRLTRFLAEEGRRGRRGTALLRRLLAIRDEGDARTESELEARLVRLLRRAKLPSPVLQHEVRRDGRLIARLDLAYPELMIAIEVHGFRWHGGRERWARDLRRENRLKRLGWLVLVYTWDDVVAEPADVVAEIRAVLDERRAPEGTRPPNSSRICGIGARTGRSSDAYARRMIPRRVASVLLLAACVACTAGPAPDARRDPSPGPSAATPASTAPVLRVVASVTGPSSEADRAHLDGMRLAERDVTGAGGPLRLSIADDEGIPERTTQLVAEAARSGDATALLVVGPGSAVSANREAIEDADLPIVLLDGDLYSTRGLFRWVFQMSVPVRWQARIAGRYFARDRGHASVLVVAESEAEAAVATEEALAEGVSDVRSVVVPGRSIRPALDAAPGADAIMALIDPPTAGRLARRLATPAQLAVPSGALGRPGFPPGTVAPYLYSWAGWAEPIPRVGRFRSRFERVAGRPPSGLEQEGYDAVRLLAAALEETDGASGEGLLRALESNRPEGPTHSALPLTLGPDDHTAVDETWIGLFAVAGPGELPEPWVPDAAPWRPIIRTFTYDGERTVFHERDRAVFFPFWRHGLPSPKYFRAVHGIVTRSEGDPLH